MCWCCSSAWTFVRLYNQLLIHCIYESVIKPTFPAFGDRLNTDSACSSNVTGIAVKLSSMALPSMICAALDGWSIDGSLCDSKKCRSLDLWRNNVSFGGHAIRNWQWQWPWNRSPRERQRQLKVNIIFNRKKDKLNKDVPFSCHLSDSVLWTGHFFLA